MENQNHAWAEFAVKGGIESFNNAFRRFDEVSHVCHLSTALSVVNSDEIKAGLVYADERMRDTRALVVWLSPNDWSNHRGYRYGGVKFDFNFASLIKGKRYYWVGSVDYEVKACRILITDKEMKSGFTSYDPTLRDGPWFYNTDAGLHYFNSNFCVEFMLEDAIPLVHLSNLGFVNHHDEYCSMHSMASTKCKERLLSNQKVASLFLMKAVVGGIPLGNVKRFFIDDNEHATSLLDFAINDFLVMASNSEYSSSPGLTDDEALACGRIVMAVYAFGQRADAKIAMKRFSSFTQFKEIAFKLISMHFNCNSVVAFQDY